LDFQKGLETYGKIIAKQVHLQRCYGSENMAFGFKIRSNRPYTLKILINNINSQKLSKCIFGL